MSHCVVMFYGDQHTVVLCVKPHDLQYEYPTNEITKIYVKKTDES